MAEKPEERETKAGGRSMKTVHGFDEMGEQDGSDDG
jgi:hypothetical protein